MQQNQSKPFHIVTIIKHAEVWNIVWNAKKKGKKYRKCSSKLSKIKNCRTMLLTKCVVCNSKKSILMKEQKAKEIWSILCLRTPLNKMPLVKYCFSNCHKYKMNKIVNIGKR